jgi:hypothetical protein
MVVLPGGLRPAGGVGVNPLAEGTGEAGPSCERTGDDTGLGPQLQAGVEIFRRVFSRPLGSSGKKRKDKRPLPKVGTPQEQAYARKRAEADVAGNFGIRGKGWVFWTAVVVIFVLGFAGVVALASL